MKIQLIPLTKKNLKELSNLMNNKTVLNEIGFFKKKYNLEDATDEFKRIQKNKDHQFFIKSQEKIVGKISLTNIDQTKKIFEIGYLIHPNFRRKGYASKAVEEVCKIGFTKLKLIRIEARVFTDNKISQKILQKNKFKKEGKTRKSMFHEGRYKDEYIFGRIK